MFFSNVRHAASYVSQKLGCIDDQAVRHFAFFLIALVVMALPDNVWAQSTIDTSGGAVGDVICNIVEVLQGDVARGVAAFGIIFLGFSLFLGKISWGVALALGIGIGAIFGANDIVDAISTGTGSGQGCDTR